MITVTYDPRHRRLELRGHAGSAPKGEDLVCAAVSALCCTLAENLRRRDSRALVILQPGYARFQCRSQDLALICVMDAFYLGFRELARSYPEYIRTRRPKRLNIKEVTQ